MVCFVVSASFIIFSEFLHLNRNFGDLTLPSPGSSLTGFVVTSAELTLWHCSKTSCNLLLLVSSAEGGQEGNGVSDQWQRTASTAWTWRRHRRGDRNLRP